MRTTSWVAAALAASVMVVTACTASPSGPAPEAAGPAAPHDLLVLDLGGGAASIDTSVGRLAPETLDAVASFDGSRLYRTERVDGATMLRTLDPGGAVLAERTLDGALQVRVASLSGGSVLLMPPLPEGVDPWTPLPRTRTTMVIADPAGAVSTTLTLRGNFEPEAFSTDDRQVFLLQYLPAEAPAAYRVVALDVATGEVSPVAGRFKTPPERMPGIRLSQVYDPARERLYTLYDNQPSTGLDHAYAGHTAGRSQTFVHVLSLDAGWAHCAGVPRSMWGSPRFDQAMAVAPDGSSVFVIDAHAGRVATLDAKSLQISSVAQVALGGGEGLRTTGSLAPDGRSLFITSSLDPGSVYRFDIARGAIDARWPVAGPASAVGVTGTGVWVAGPGRLERLDPATGMVTQTLALPGVERVVHLLHGGG
jgi:hypothetical protein